MPSSGTAETSTESQHPSSPPGSDAAVYSIKFSKCLDENAEEYDVGFGHACSTRQAGNLVGYRPPASCAASGAWNMRHSSLGPVALISLTPLSGYAPWSAPSQFLPDCLRHPVLACSLPSGVQHSRTQLGPSSIARRRRTGLVDNVCSVGRFAANVDEPFSLTPAA